MKVNTKNKIKERIWISKIAVSNLIREWREKYGFKLRNWNDIAEIRRWRQRKTR